MRVIVISAQWEPMLAGLGDAYTVTVQRADRGHHAYQERFAFTPLMDRSEHVLRRCRARAIRDARYSMRSYASTP